MSEHAHNRSAPFFLQLIFLQLQTQKDRVPEKKKSETVPLFTDVVCFLHNSHRSSGRLTSLCGRESDVQQMRKGRGLLGGGGVCG